MLEKFLASKPLYYDLIDYSRMPRVYACVKESIKLPKIIHIVGTNGKGTTGRFLATALYRQGYKVGHYTSPHILRFNERIWLNGADIDDARLNKKHHELLQLLSSDDAQALSYFEYTTLLALYIYQDMDYLVLEAGLGGEYDATAVFDNILTLVTPIDKDHEAFLGENIIDIASTKMNAIQKHAILAQQNHDLVYEVAETISQQKQVKIERNGAYLDGNDALNIEQIAQKNHLPNYLKENLSLAIAALKYLGIDYRAESFKASRLFGRLTRLEKNILLDVGHNTLAAQSIVESLQGSKFTLVYNSFKDKDYKNILQILKPIIDEVALIKIQDYRAESLENIESALEDLSLRYYHFKELEKEKEYLVFGSFSVAEAFLKVCSDA